MDGGEVNAARRARSSKLKIQSSRQAPSTEFQTQRGTVGDPVSDPARMLGEFAICKFFALRSKHFRRKPRNFSLSRKDT
jgi:hypothetical protein